MSDLKDLTPMVLDSLLGKRQLLRHDDSSDNDLELDIEMNRDGNKHIPSRTPPPVPTPRSVSLESISSSYSYSTSTSTCVSSIPNTPVTPVTPPCNLGLGRDSISLKSPTKVSATRSRQPSIVSLAGARGYAYHLPTPSPTLAQTQAAPAVIPSPRNAIDVGTHMRARAQTDMDINNTDTQRQTEQEQIRMRIRRYASAGNLNQGNLKQSFFSHSHSALSGSGLSPRASTNPSPNPSFGPGAGFGDEQYRQYSYFDSLAVPSPAEAFQQYSPHATVSLSPSPAIRTRSRSSSVLAFPLPPISPIRNAVYFDLPPQGTGLDAQGEGKLELERKLGLLDIHLSSASASSLSECESLADASSSIASPSVNIERDLHSSDPMVSSLSSMVDLRLLSSESSGPGRLTTTPETQNSLGLFATSGSTPSATAPKSTPAPTSPTRTPTPGTPSPVKRKRQRLVSFIKIARKMTGKLETDSEVGTEPQPQRQLRIRGYPEVPPAPTVVPTRMAETSTGTTRMHARIRPPPLDLSFSHSQSNSRLALTKPNSEGEVGRSSLGLSPISTSGLVSISLSSPATTAHIERSKAELNVHSASARSGSMSNNLMSGPEMRTRTQLVESNSDLDLDIRRDQDERENKHEDGLDLDSDSDSESEMDYDMDLIAVAVGFDLPGTESESLTPTPLSRPTSMTAPVYATGTPSGGRPSTDESSSSSHSPVMQTDPSIAPETDPVTPRGSYEQVYGFRSPRSPRSPLSSWSACAAPWAGDSLTGTQDEYELEASVPRGGTPTIGLGLSMQAKPLDMGTQSLIGPGDLPPSKSTRPRSISSVSASTAPAAKRLSLKLDTKSATRPDSQIVSGTWTRVGPKRSELPRSPTSTRSESSSRAPTPPPKKRLATAPTTPISSPMTSPSPSPLPPNSPSSPSKNIRKVRTRMSGLISRLTLGSSTSLVGSSVSLHSQLQSPSNFDSGSGWMYDQSTASKRNSYVHTPPVPPLPPTLQTTIRGRQATMHVDELGHNVIDPFAKDEISSPVSAFGQDSEPGSPSSAYASMPMSPSTLSTFSFSSSSSSGTPERSSSLKKKKQKQKRRSIGLTLRSIGRAGTLGVMGR